MVEAGMQHDRRRVRRGLFTRWLVANAVGVMLGLGVAAVCGSIVQEWLEGRVGVILAVAASALVFGGIEGCLLGMAQHRVLVWPLPFMELRLWVEATAAGTGLVWLVVALPVALVRESGGVDPTLAVRIVGAVGIGLIAGPFLGMAQWSVLRLRASGTEWWMLGTALAWVAAAPVVLFGAVVSSDATSVGGVLGVAFPVLLAAGVVVGAVQGVFLVRRLGDRLDPNDYVRRVADALRHQSLHYGRDEEA